MKNLRSARFHSLTPPRGGPCWSPQERRQIEEEIYRWGVLRYGWREEDLEGVPGVKVKHDAKLFAFPATMREMVE